MLCAFIDFKTPVEVTIKTNDLPFSISLEIINIDQVSNFTKESSQITGDNFNKQKSLFASHRAQDGYLILMNLLKLCIELGSKYTKIHRVCRFKQEGVLSDFFFKLTLCLEIMQRLSLRKICSNLG